MITVAVVFKSGGCYEAEHVERIKKSFEKHYTGDYEFVCLTDAAGAAGICRRLPLEEGLYGWWSKLELFRPGLFDYYPVFYIDLDSIVVGDTAHFTNSSMFTIVEDFYRKKKRFQSTLMLFGEKHAERIWNKYLSTPLKFLKRRVANWRGDQDFIEEALGGTAQYFQELYPGEVVSYKAHCCNKKKEFVSVPEGTKVICYHGSPKPWETELWNMGEI